MYKRQARDLAPLGYEVHVYDGDKKAGGMIRSQIPRFRLPEEVIDEEVGYITSLGPVMHLTERVDSLKALMAEGYDAIFVGTGAPRGRDLDIPGRKEGAANIHIGIDWLSNVSFEHTSKIGKRVIVLGGGNTAMDCCRTSRRLGGEDVKVIVRSGFDEMKASPWEKEDAMHEDIPIINFLNPREFTHKDGKLTGVTFQKMQWAKDEKGKRSLVPTGEPDQHFECDDVLIAVGQENSFPWIERDVGMDFDKWGMPVVGQETMQSTIPNVFFGGDAAFGPKNIIWAVAHGHAAAVSIDMFLSGQDISVRPAPGVTAVSYTHLETQNHGLEGALDHKLIKAAKAALGKTPKPVQINEVVNNVNRTVGAMLSGEVARKFGHAGLPDDTIQISLTGTAGQSFGAFIARGVTITLVGDGNDYVGKGLSGGRVIVKQPDNVKRDPTENIIVGNTVLYGAIAGEAYFEGVAGERFAVRNSGAVAVVEGCGDHGCEYMTGGVVVVLGETGRNFAAGMSGGIAYVYDPKKGFVSRCNPSMVALEPLKPAEGGPDADAPQQRSLAVDNNGMGDMLRFDAERLRILVERHLLHTGSARARELLDNWSEALTHFVKVMPTDYARALKDMQSERQRIVAAE